MVKIVFRVDGMHCTNCPMNVESIEDDLPGIKKVTASYQKGQMVVEYDEAQVSETQIMTAVEKRGYHAEAM
jgi:copper chaperone CopZ